VLTLIRPEVLRSADALCREFQSAQPFRHVVIDEFLDAEFCRRLVEDFPEFDAQQATNELGQVGRKAVRRDLASLSQAYARFDQLLQSQEFLQFLNKSTGIPKLIYDPDYVGGGTHENLAGQDLDMHVDFNYHPASRLHRRLNLILFLNREWQPEWGGSLELQRDPALPSPENCTRMVLPIENRSVIFETTESSWHGFRRIELPAGKQHLSRRSIAVYFYTKERPAHEAAPSHGTIYVPRPLPGHLQPDYRLTSEDVHELEILLARRDAQIQYLYEREKEFSRIAGSPSFRLARGLTWPMRTLRDWAKRSK
jgi:Rps23 Pro-64 3,4-dihydroxylase Tpa1-like proline 4-hydroxylase